MDYRKVLNGEIKGWVREDLACLLPSRFFEDPLSYTRQIGGEVLKESRFRSAAILRLADSQRIFLKRDRTKGWDEFLKYLFVPSRGRKEWLVSYQLQEKNLPIPKPLGWLEKRWMGFVKESYFLCEAIGPGMSLDDSLRSGQRAPLNQLVSLVKKIHDSGLFHADLHVGNFL